MTEDELYDWLLAQRILASADALDADKMTRLDEELSEWNKPVEDDELAHAIAVDDPELNAAVETWWNVTGMPSAPLTFSEIRVKAAMEA